MNYHYPFMNTIFVINNLLNYGKLLSNCFVKYFIRILLLNRTFRVIWDVRRSTASCRPTTRDF